VRVLFLAPQPFFSQRGTPIAVREAVSALSSGGHRIDLVTYHCGEDVSVPNVTIHRIRAPWGVRRVPVGLSWQKLVCDWLLLLLARRLVRSNRYDVVHGVEEAAFIGLWLHLRTGLAFVYDMDSLLSEQIENKSAWLWPAARLCAWLEHLTLSRSRGVVAVCPALVEAARLHHPAGNILLLPDMPTTDSSSSEPDAELAALPGIRLLYVGNLEPYQGVDMMLEAFARVAAECPEATLIVVGGSPEDIAACERRVADLVRTGRVRFLGPRPLDRLASVLLGADILISPRNAGRNTPMKIYSYLESGRAVLATRMLTHTQVLTDDVACLVDPSPAGLADGMRRLIRDPELRRRLGARGRQHVQDHYSRAQFHARLCGFYTELEQASDVSDARAPHAG